VFWDSPKASLRAELEPDILSQEIWQFLQDMKKIL